MRAEAYSLLEKMGHTIVEIRNYLVATEDVSERFDQAQDLKTKLRTERLESDRTARQSMPQAPSGSASRLERNRG